MHPKQKNVEEYRVCVLTKVVIYQTISFKWLVNLFELYKVMLIICLCISR